MSIVYLRRARTSLAIDARGPGLPRVAHWGRDLGPLDPGDLEQLAAAARPPASVASFDRPVTVSLLPEASAGWTGRPALRGHRNGLDWSTAFRLDALEVDEDSAEITVTAVDPVAALTLVIEITLDLSGLLLLRHRLRNDGDTPYELQGLAGTLPVPAVATELLDLTGRWCRERVPQRHPWHLGSWVRESRHGRTGHDATLLMVAGTPGFSFRQGEVWAWHTAWSGDHLTYAERQPTGESILGGGELLAPGEVVLDPGESYTTPRLYAAWADSGLDGLSAAFYAHLRGRPQHPRTPRPVTLNVWEAVYFDHDIERLRRLADEAAAVGVERFVLDDGWFRGRRNDTAGLGDWYVDEQVWPDGLQPLIDHVTGLGLEFGLWVEPEMVNPDSDLFRAHPEWTMAPTGRLPMEWRHQQVLDLANPDAYRYILDRLDAILTQHPDIRYLKWDHNRDLSEAGHHGRPGVHQQTLSLYRLIDELRARHPHVEIESCSSGGARVDLEILRRTDRIWASDCNDALERAAIGRWTGLLLPPELVGHHIGPERSHTTGRVHDLGFRAAVALIGHYGIEWDITAISPEHKAELGAWVALHKRLRPLLHTSAVVRVDHPDPATWITGVVADDRRHAVFVIVRVASSVTQMPGVVRLPGLDPESRYSVRPMDGVPRPRIHRVPEPAWMTQGIAVNGAVLESVGLHLPALHPEQALVLDVQAT